MRRAGEEHREQRATVETGTTKFGLTHQPALEGGAGLREHTAPERSG
jgi:hypothetical protein